MLKRNTQWLSRSQLFRGSFWLLLASVSDAALGFLFWVLAAKAYTRDSVGITTATISLIALAQLFSRFGLDQSLVRHFPQGNKNRIMMTSMAVTLLSSILMGVIFMTLSKSVATESGINLLAGGLLVIVIIAAESTTYFSAMALVAMRQGKFYWIQRIIVNTKVLFVVPLATIGVGGMVLAYGIPVVLASLFSLSVLYRLGIHPSGFDRSYLSRSLRYSAANYIVTIFTATPYPILALVVLAVAGAGQTACFSLAYAISSLVMMVPNAFSTSLLVEGSHGEDLREQTAKALRLSYLFQLPLVVAIALLGGIALGLIGSQYLPGKDFLVLSSISGLGVPLCSIFTSVMRIRKRVRMLVLFNSVVFFVLLSSSVFLLHFVGIAGVGIGWVVAYGLGSLIAFIYLVKDGSLL